VSDAALPPLLTPAQVGRACRMSRRKAKNLLRAVGILELIGERWFVAESRLRDRLPDVYDRVYEAHLLGPAMPASAAPNGSSRHRATPRDT
jgi:hypothetical protein